MSYNKEKDRVLLEESKAVLTIPARSVSMTINVDVYQDGEIVTVSKLFDFDDIRRMINEAEDAGLVDEQYVLTEKGREYACGCGEE